LLDGSLITGGAAKPLTFLRRRIKVKCSDADEGRGTWCERDGPREVHRSAEEVVMVSSRRERQLSSMKSRVDWSKELKRKEAKARRRAEAKARKRQERDGR